MVSPLIANRAYDVLVEECDASERERHRFVHYLTNTGHGYKEWRFSGSLGFGGKFWLYPDSCRVSCYVEDQTPERLRIISRANDILAAVVTPYLEEGE